MKTISLTIAAAAMLGLAACKPPASNGGSSSNAKPKSNTHTHADGTVHDDDAHDAPMGDDHDHAHDEVSLGTAMVGDMTVEFAQGHGAVAPGKEGHLVVKLPYSDRGATIVRAWIGTEDRTMSFVGRADYAASHDDYDVHAMAPIPLPADVRWWVEIERPDGTKVVGSVKPKLE